MTRSNVCNFDCMFAHHEICRFLAIKDEKIVSFIVYLKILKLFLLD